MSQETAVLSGLQQLRGSVIAGYCALYTVMGDLSKSRSEESIERLIEGASRDGEEEKRKRKKRSRERPRTAKTM
jgi:hypothetical protein